MKDRANSHRPLFRFSRLRIESLWRDFFSDTSKWWDHRPEKTNPRFPDFKHKRTEESLWLVDARNPPWVQEKLAAITPGTLQYNVFAWTQKLKRHSKAGQYIKTMEVFHHMQQEGICPDTRTFLPVLNACAGLGALEEGKRIHTQILQVGYESDIYVGSCLVDMYAKCGSIDDAWIVFNKMPVHDVVTWTAIIGGYVKSGQGLKAIELFQKMQQEGVEPNAVTFVGVLNACASVVALQEGRRVHEEIIRRGCQSDVYVGSCLIDMYCKCGSIDSAWIVFRKMREHNVVTWNTMIGGYVKSGQGMKAMELFQKMQQEGVEPNVYTFVGVLNACASVGALEEGHRIHQLVAQRGFECNVYVGSCLIDMYSKCGSIENAWSVFNTMPIQDVVCWTTMIGGYAMHGHAKRAIGLFSRMSKEGIEINVITFTCLLSACSHGGLVKEGLRYFKSMGSSYDISPTVEHYACMVDLLGRAGRLEEAEELTTRMPLKSTIVSVWMSLLGACRIHGNIKMAERAANRCWELDPDNASGHVLLSNTYATAGKWDYTEEEKSKRHLWKESGCSLIEVNHMVHTFVADDKGHPLILEIHAELEVLSVQMNEAGYGPQMKLAWTEELSLVSPQ